jgi:NADH-quinone oxidoreductase subunit L
MNIYFYYYPFIGFLFIFLRKSIGKSASGSLEPLLFSLLFWLQLISLNNTSNPANQISLFDWIQISNFKVDFGFLLDQLSILWLLL